MTALVVGAAALTVFVVGLVTASTTIPVRARSILLRSSENHEVWAVTGGVHVSDLAGVQRLASDLTPVAVALAVLAFVLHDLVSRFRGPVDVEGDGLGRLAGLFVTAGVAPTVLGFALDAWVLAGLDSHNDWTMPQLREPVTSAGFVLVGAYILLFERRDRRRTLYSTRTAVATATPSAWSQRLGVLAAEQHRDGTTT